MKVDLVEVEWLDHASTDEWIDLDNIADMPLQSIYSVGYLVYENKEKIVLSASIDIANNSSGQTHSIVKSCITKRKVLKKVEFTS